MTTKRTTISISDAIYAQAEAVMELRSFSDFSGFLHQLIREEYERRHGPVTMQDKNKEESSQAMPVKPVTYPKARLARKHGLNSQHGITRKEIPD